MSVSSEAVMVVAPWNPRIITGCLSLHRDGSGWGSFSGKLADLYRALLVMGLPGSQPEHHGHAPVIPVDRGGGIIANAIDELPDLLDVAGCVAVHEEMGQSGAVESVPVALVQCSLRFVVRHGNAVAAQNFQPLIVAVHRLAAIIDGADGAIGELQGHDGGIEVAEFCDLRGEQDVPDGVQFLALAQLEACHVEVVDGHIQEHAAAILQVLQRRRLRVAGDDMDDARPADFTRCDDLMHPLKALVEAAVETYLQLYPGRIHHIQRVIDLAEVKAEGFLAKDVLAGPGAILQDRRVGGGVGGNQHRLDGWVGQQFVVIAHHALDAQFGGDRLRDLEPDVANGAQVDPGDLPDDVSHVNAAHPAGADHCQVYFTGHAVTSKPCESCCDWDMFDFYGRMTIFMAFLGIRPRVFMSRPRSSKAVGPSSSEITLVKKGAMFKRSSRKIRMEGTMVF